MSITTIRNITKAQLISTLDNLENPSRGDVLETLGISRRDPRARKILNEKAEKWGLDLLFSNNRQKQYTDDDVRTAVESSLCISEALDKIGLTKHGSNFQTIRKLCERLNISTEHFNSNAARIRSNGKTVWTRDNIFVENSLCARGNLRKHVLKHNILPTHACEECGNLGIWNEKVLKLQVDHINGINNDNRPENLRWLCPNCHSQTDTFGT